MLRHPIKVLGKCDYTNDQIAAPHFPHPGSVNDIVCMHNNISFAWRWY